MRFLASAGLIMILSGLGAYYATNQLSVFSIANLILGPAGVILGGLVEWRRFRGFEGIHSHKVLLRWSLTFPIVLIGVVALNVLGQKWSGSIDLTREHRYTLSDQTRKACATFSREAKNAPLTLWLLKDAPLAQDVSPLIQAYRAACPGLETRRVRSSDLPPLALPVVQTMEATVIVCNQERCEGAGFPTEDNITNALIRLFSDRRIEVDFLVGHGEVNLADPGVHGYSDLAAQLRDEGLRVGALVGPAHKNIPARIDLLIAAGPGRDLLPAEIDALDRYLRSGGRLLALLEPNRHTNLQDLLQRWGFGFPDGVIADRQNSPLLADPSPLTLLVNSFESYHPVTRPLSRRTMVLLPGARAVLAQHKPAAEDRLTPLIYSSPHAWIEHDVRNALAGRSLLQDRSETTGQEIPLAAAGQYPHAEGETRIVVIGDRDFVSNRLIWDLYNSDLLMNAVLWLVEDEARIAIRPKAWTPDQDPLTLQQTLAYFYFMAFALPELLLLLGIHAWYRQRGL